MPTKKRREFLNRATEVYAASVEDIAPYLDSRGLRAETVAEWKLGYVKDPLSGDEDYAGRLAIPYLTPAGTVSMKFRCVAEHSCKTTGCVKYLGPPNEMHLFGTLNFKYDLPSLVLAEGELDTIISTQAGVRAVGVPGSSVWLPWWDHLFEGYDEVVLARDGDPAGRKMAESLSVRLANLRPVKMPEGEDISSFVLSYGGGAYRERLAA